MDILTMLNFGVLYTLIFGIIATIFFYILYNHVIAKFSKNYDNFIKILRNVKDNDMNFMNFGYWDEKDINLTEANRRLCDFVIDKADIKHKKFLDIGCGYGEQDFYWNKKYGYKIDAIDISKKQISYAKNKSKITENKHVNFLQGDATDLPFKEKSYHNIICLESAFHYNPRKDFFDESYRILKDNDSELVIADIVLKNKNYGYLQSGFVNFFKELLSVPEDNLIIVDEYVKDLQDSGFEVRKFNITDKTFKPYFTNFIKNHRFSFAIYNKLIQVICNNLDYVPFEYYIFKCKKLKK